MDTITMVLSSIFTILAALVFPVGVLLYCLMKRRNYVKPFLIGVATFVVFQVLTRIPLLQMVLPGMAWFNLLPYVSPILYALFLGLTAALFEEIGRYIMMRWLLKKHRGWWDAVVFGLGHGGIEAILFAGMNALITVLFFSGTDMVSSFMMFAGGLERISAMTMHVGWSIMVMASIRTGKTWYLLLAIGLHALVDTGSVLLQSAGLNTMWIEGILLISAILMAGYILYSRRNWKEA